MTTVMFASNQGAIGGGEVVLLAMAQATRSEGHDITVVAPGDSTELVDAATELGFPTVTIDSRSRGGYLRGLRQWDARHRDGLLWCNGLRPAFATSGHGRRVIHLHQLPTRRQHPLATVARRGAIATIVPSQMMRQRLPGTRVLANWTADAPARSRTPGGAFVVGYLGRLSSDKGVRVLCQAVEQLDRTSPGTIELLLAGETRFVSDADAALVAESVAGLGSTVRNLGWVDRSTFFDAVDLAVFPSIWAEPFGLVAAEAMAARCPFIVSDAGALPEVVGADYPWTVPTGDAAALADRIRSAMTATWDQQLLESRRRWEDHFSPTAGATRFRTLLQDVLMTVQGQI